MKQLSRKNLILVGLTLFSMFFGAGNLIFPPFLGQMSGTNMWIAMFGFAVTAIGFPILGVVAVAKSGGLDALAKRVHPIFSFIFTLLIYISIGPGLAIPRTAGTSFEMAVLPFLSEGMPADTMRLVYSCIFFFIAFLIALKPEKLTDRLGKILTPCLLVLITIIFILCLLHPMGNYGSPVNKYVSNPFTTGFLEGYQTMDTIAALNFGILIAINIKARGIKEENDVVRETIKAGFIAGIILLCVYSALGHMGALTSGVNQTSANGAETLTLLVNFLLGKFGLVLLGIIFFIACLNTCVGLLCCCSEYFYGLVPKIPYRMWLLLFTIISVMIANLGLSAILQISSPVLQIIYPVAIVLITLAFIHPRIKKYKLVYPITIGATGIVSIISVLNEKNVKIAGVSHILEQLPFYDAGLVWFVPAIISLLISIILSFVWNKKGINNKL